MSDRLVLLGTKGGPSVRTGGPSPSASLLQVGGKPYVIDCGLGVTRGFVEAGLHLSQLNTIFLTHHHSDHTLEFGALVHTAWTTGLKQNVKAFGPPGTVALWRAFVEMMAIDIRTRIVDEGRPEIVSLCEVADFECMLSYADGTVRVDALRVEHPPMTDTFALRFRFNGKTIVFSADTCFFPPLAEFARDADVLVHEAMHVPGIDALLGKIENAGPGLRTHMFASHTPAEDVGRLAAMAGVKHLVLNHFVPSADMGSLPEHYEAAVRTGFPGRLTIGRDGLEIPL